MKGKFDIAYFSAEIGISRSLPTYSGGLGVLAGDHIKSAADLGLNMCGITLLYKEGYFKQRIDEEGIQTENYPKLLQKSNNIGPKIDPEAVLEATSYPNLFFHRFWKRFCSIFDSKTYPKRDKNLMSNK